MQWLFPCIIFYNSKYVPKADLALLIERLRQRFLENQYDIPVRHVDVEGNLADDLEDMLNKLGLRGLDELLSRYRINLSIITDNPIFVIENGPTKQKFQNIEEYLQTLTGIMRP